VHKFSLCSCRLQDIDHIRCDRSRDWDIFETVVMEFGAKSIRSNCVISEFMKTK